MALAYLLASADADLVGIASTAGNVPVQQVCCNNLGLLELCQITGVPVSKGSEQPVSAPLRTAEDTHEPHPPRTASARSRTRRPRPAPAAPRPGWRRTLLPPFIFRRLIRRKRRLHRVLRNPQHPGDHLDRQSLGPAQTTNLSPISHRQHSLLILLARLEPGHRTRGSKFGCRAGVSFHLPPIIATCWCRSKRQSIE
jgi:hypothetical protein